MGPAEALERIAFLLERSLAPSYRVQAFRRAASVVKELDSGELQQRAGKGRLRDLPGIGKATEGVILDALSGNVPDYLRRLQEEMPPSFEAGDELLAALRGDCHTHSTWSDGLTSIIDMAHAARALGRQYIVMSDHSPRLTIANGLSTERLMHQLDELEEVNAALIAEEAAGAAPFRVLSGIEVDILEDGSLDQSPDVLERLDVVVGSVHSKLRMDAASMTARMVAAVEDPHMDILGHCTGRLVTGRGRPQSEFDAKEVFAACVDSGVAVEINSRPERKDPPMNLLALAVETGCTFTIDSDAHAPGQLDWLPIGCDRAARAGVTAERIVNTRDADDLTRWTSDRR